MKISNLKLEIAMAKQCYTFKKLAEKSGLTESQVNNIYSKRSKPRPITVGKLARALDCNVEDLLEDDQGEENGTE